MIPEDIIFNISRDVNIEELSKKPLVWWEVPLYLSLLAAMLISEVLFLNP